MAKHGRDRSRTGFPPPSTSLLLGEDGSDRDFRQLVYSLITLGQLIVRHREYYGAYLGVTGRQYVIMAILSLASTASVRQIAEQMDVSSQFVTAEVNKLIKRKIIEKNLNQADRRSVLLKLTGKGRDLIRELAPLRRQSNDLMYRSLTVERLKILQHMITALTEDAKIAMHELEAPPMRGKRAPSAS